MLNCQVYNELEKVLTYLNLVGITAKTVDYTVGSELINIVCPGNYLLRLYLKFQIDESTSRVIHKSKHIEFNLTVRCT